MTLRLQLRRCQSRGFLAFSLQSCGLGARCCFVASGLLTLRLQLRCARCLDTSRFFASCQQTLRLQLCRNPSRGFNARQLFLASCRLTLRLQLCRSQLRGFLAFGLQSCCSRRLDTSRFLTSCQQTLRVQLCRSPSRGFDARDLFLTSGCLTLRLQLCRGQSRGFLAFGLQSCSLDARRSLLTSGLPFRGLNPGRLQLILLFRKFSSSLPNVLADSLLGYFEGISMHRHHGLRDRSSWRCRND